MPVALISGIFLLFLADALFQITLPTVLVTEGGLSATTAGLMLSLGLGAGILVVAPVAQRSDNGTRSRILFWCTLPLALATLLFVAVSHVSFSLWLWIIPIAVYGLMRTPLTVVWLAYITERGDKLRMQAANGIAQRTAVAFAALIVAYSTIGSGSATTFIVLALIMLVVVAVASWLFRKDSIRLPLNKPSRSRPYGRSIQLLRSRSLQASSALNASIVLVTILGNAFFPLGLIGETPAYIAIWVLIFLVTRDLVGSLTAGLMFRFLYARFGIVGSLAFTAALIVSGLILLAIPGRSLVITLLSALLQGFACATAIGCTNLLAVHGGGGAERATRIGATQYLPSAVMLIAPAPLGMIFDYSNIHMVFLAGSIICCVLMTFVLYQVSPKRNTLKADFSAPTVHTDD
ncbi:MAG: MFS transporter [Leucobacter sp.]